MMKRGWRYEWRLSFQLPGRDGGERGRGGISISPASQQNERSGVGVTGQDTLVWQVRSRAYPDSGGFNVCSGLSGVTFYRWTRKIQRLMGIKRSIMEQMRTFAFLNDRSVFVKDNDTCIDAHTHRWTMLSCWFPPLYYWLYFSSSPGVLSNSSSHRSIK